MARPDIARPALTDYQKRAFKALAAGIANEGQQRAVAEALLHKISCVDADCFGQDARHTDFALGRRWVGLVVRELFLLPADALGMDTDPPQQG